MGSEDWRDPYGIVPRSFRNEYPNADSVREALDHAGRLPSSTPEAARARCPDCDSPCISPHNTAPDGDRAPGDWMCEECASWFDDPVQPEMTDYQTRKSTRFRWINDGDLRDPASRSSLDPPFADVERETAVALAILLRRPWRDDERRKYPEIARYLPYADSWVGHRIREWRDGDHRDLVPDPTAEAEPEPSNDPPIDPSVALARIGGDYEELVDERTEAPSAETDTAPEAAADGGTRRSRWAAYGRG